MPDLPGNWTSYVDRRAFIPDVIYVQREARGNLVAVSRHDEPGLWEEQVASDEPVVTKLKPIVLPDGSELPFWPVSSSSAPSIMNIMLDELRLQPDLSVLEIGTGTGWNAAILAQVGAVVTTVEIDMEVATRARAALDKAGYGKVVVITGDGELGAPDRAPYDRLIATAAVSAVPYEWVRQTSEGGLIVFPYTGQDCAHGIAVLTVHDRAASGTIRSQGRAGFMPLRDRGLTQAKLQNIENAAEVKIVVTEHGQKTMPGQEPGLPDRMRQ